LWIFDDVKSARDRNSMFAHAKRSQSKRAIEAMLWLARSEPGIPARLTDFDAKGWLLNVENGTIHLKTAEVRPHNRTDLISNIVRIPYVSGAACELWDAFLWRITQSEALPILRRAGVRVLVHRWRKVRGRWTLREVDLS
jgi:putative DNA primase/helicase